MATMYLTEHESAPLQTGQAGAQLEHDVGRFLSQWEGSAASPDEASPILVALVAGEKNLVECLNDLHCVAVSLDKIDRCSV